MANSNRRCFSCKKYFPQEDMIIVPVGALCSDKCIQSVITKSNQKKREQAIEQAKWQKKEDKRIDAKVKKIKSDNNLNNRSLRTKSAQDAFNAFIRKRDEKENCVSCGGNASEVTYLRGGKWDCGHFQGVGAHPELRFNEDNAHKQCKKCNGGSGKFARKNESTRKSYTINLIKKIGQDRVDFLTGPHEAAKHSCEDLKKIELKFKKKLKEL